MKTPIFTPTINHSTVTRTQPVLILKNSNIKYVPCKESDTCHPSLHDKLLFYYKRREEIFNNNSTDSDYQSAQTTSGNHSKENNSSKEPKIIQVRNKFKEKSSFHKAIESSILNDINVGSDNRTFLQVKIGHSFTIGLVDSGANITCLGKNSESFLEKCGLTYTPLNTSVKTAGGNSKPIVGYIKTSITFRGHSEEFTVFIAPSLVQELYLGIDFIKRFKLAPDIFPSPKISEISITNPLRHILSDTEEKELTAVINMFPNSEVLGLGKTHLEFHTIDTKDCQPIKSRHYPVSPAIQELMDKEIDRMLSLGVIEPSESPWASPVTLVRKPNKNRLCLDFRKINDVTTKLAYPIPNIDGILSRLSHTKYITAIDLKDAFWQIPLDLKSREKTAFVVPGKPLFHWTVMPFGLCNAPQRMMILMDKVIPQEIKERVFVYLDDLLVVSSDFKSHLETLKIVANCLRKAGLTINIQKSNFCFKEVNYLGFVIGEGCIKTDSQKTSSISNFPLPKSKKQVRGFLGLSGWYRRFIENFASVAAPLSDTIKGDKFVMTDEAKTSFEKLKNLLTTPPVLAQPDFTRTFHLQCDASNSGIGAVLFQVDDNGEEKPLYYYSAKLTSAEKNYSVTERECLAVIKSVKKFRPYLEGYTFNIITDHSSLKWLMSTKDLSGRLARWSLKLQPYSFNIHHRKGKDNVVPDCLSRQFSVDSIDLESQSPEDICSFTIDFKDPAFTEPEYVDLISYVADNKDQVPDVMESNGFVYKRTCHSLGDEIFDMKTWKLWIPSALRAKLISDAHDPPDKAHGGIAKTLHRLRERFYWPYMALEVRAYIKSCEKCQTSKSPNTILRPPMGDCFHVERTFQHLYIDFLGPYPRTKHGYTTMFIVLDHLSKFVLLEPLKSSKTSLIILFLKNRVFDVFGTPETIFSDNGSEFRSKDFGDFLSSQGVKLLNTPKYTPQSNSSERVNRSIVEAIRCYIEEHSTWDENLGEITSALRSSVHQTLRVSPYEALFGQTMVQCGKDYELLRKLDALNCSGLEVIPRSDRQQVMHEYFMKHIKKANESSAKRYNTRARENSFRVDDEVYCRTFPVSSFSNNYTAKFAPKFRKARVLNILGKNRYELADRGGKSLGVYHAKDIKPM